MTSSQNAAPKLVDASVAVSAEGWFASVSPAFLELIGRPVESLAGSNLVDHLHPNDAGAVRELLAEAGEPGDGVGGGTIGVRVFTADERWAPIALTVAAVADGRRTVRFHGALAEPGPPHRLQQPPLPSARLPSEGAPRVLSGESRELPKHARSATSMAGFLEPGDDEFPYRDLDEHADAARGFPGSDITELRAAARARGGPPGAPMLEIDSAGRTVYVAGAWEMLRLHDGDGDLDGSVAATGAEVFEVLLMRAGTAEPILQSIDDACTSAMGARHPLNVEGLPPRWVQIQPIPSPHLAGETHALVSVLAESDLG